MDLTAVLQSIASGTTVGVLMVGVNALKAWRDKKKASQSTDEAEWKKMVETALETLTDNDSSMKFVQKIIMKDRVRYLAKKHIGEGAISLSDRAGLVEMHECYHDALGGNGELNDLMNLVKDLPIKKE